MSNLRYTIIHHDIREKYNLTVINYAIAEAIYHLSHSEPYDGNQQFIADFLGINRSTVAYAIPKLKEKGLISDEGGLSTTELWYDEVIVKKSQRFVKKSPKLSKNHNHSIYNKEDKYITADADYKIVDEEPEEPRAKDNHTKEYDKLIKWLRDLTGAPLINKAKQYAHLKKAREADISPTRLKNRATELWEKPFYRENGMDWGGVVSSFDKKA